MSSRPSLSICIPTFNRRERVVSLVQSVLETPGQVEVCVHVDGSEDDTIEQLARISDSRLVLSASPNRGRASAIATAIAASRGRFVMLFDDDDTLYRKGLEQILDSGWSSIHGTGFYEPVANSSFGWRPCSLLNLGNCIWTQTG